MSLTRIPLPLRRFRAGLPVLLLLAVLAPGAMAQDAGPCVGLDPAIDHVIIMAGQSNMAGEGHLSEVADLPRPTSHANITLYQGKRDRKTFGPELTFLQALAEACPEHRFIVVKYARGGSSLMDWDPVWSPEKAGTTRRPCLGPLYFKLMKRLKRAVGNKKVDYLALLWMQGERDAAFLKAGRVYYDNLKRFIQYLRNDLQTQDLPILIGQINPTPKRYQAKDLVAAAQSRASGSINRVYLVSTTGLSKYMDQVHYDSKGQLELGRRFARAFFATLPR